MGKDTERIVRDSGIIPTARPPVYTGGGPPSAENQNYVDKFSEDTLVAVRQYKDYKHREWPDPPNTYSGVNGNLPDDNLTYLGAIGMPHLKLRSDAAESFIRLVNDARKVGINPGFTGTLQAYRTYAGSYSLLDPTRWIKTGKIGLPENKDTARTRTKADASAAYPGTSNHGWGVAVDIQNNTSTAKDYPNSTKDRVQCWMKWFGGEYDWVWAGSMFKENWHFEYKPGTWVDQIMGFDDTVRESKYGRYDWGFNPDNGKSTGQKIKGLCLAGVHGGFNLVGNFNIQDKNPKNV